jgi:methylmalonyl-CoA/ethylmalonyl-CoA epimerase
LNCVFEIATIADLEINSRYDYCISYNTSNINKDSIVEKGGLFVEKSILGTKVVTQIGILVNDINETSQQYADFLGVENPGFVITNVYDETRTEFKGLPTMARSKLAFFKVGENLSIELIEPDHEPSTWRESLDKNGEGVHHIAFVVNGMQGKILKLEKNNMPLLQKGEYKGGRYAYVDCIRNLKVIVELLEND